MVHDKSCACNASEKTYAYFIQGSVLEKFFIYIYLFDIQCFDLEDLIQSHLVLPLTGPLCTLNLLILSQIQHYGSAYFLRDLIQDICSLCNNIQQYTKANETGWVVGGRLCWVTDWSIIENMHQ